MKSTLFLVPDKYKRVIFICLLVVCIIFPMDSAPEWEFYVNAPVALLLGIIVALGMGNPFIKMNKKATTLLLQISVVCLGFHLDVQHALKAGQQGFIFTVCTIPYFKRHRNLRWERNSSSCPNCKGKRP